MGVVAGRAAAPQLEAAGCSSRIRDVGPRSYHDGIASKATVQLYESVVDGRVEDRAHGVGSERPAERFGCRDDEAELCEVDLE